MYSTRIINTSILARFGLSGVQRLISTTKTHYYLLVAQHTLRVNDIYTFDNNGSPHSTWNLKTNADTYKEMYA